VRINIFESRFFFYKMAKSFHQYNVFKDVGKITGVK